MEPFVYIHHNPETGKTTRYDADGFIIESVGEHGPVILPGCLDPTQKPEWYEHGPEIKQTDNAFERIEKKVDALTEQVLALINEIRPRTP